MCFVEPSLFSSCQGISAGLFKQADDSLPLPNHLPPKKASSQFFDFSYSFRECPWVGETRPGPVLRPGPFFFCVVYEVPCGPTFQDGMVMSFGACGYLHPSFSFFLLKFRFLLPFSFWRKHPPSFSQRPFPQEDLPPTTAPAPLSQNPSLM